MENFRASAVASHFHSKCLSFDDANYPRNWRNMLRICTLLYIISLISIISYGYLQGFRSTPSALDMDELEYWKIGGELVNGQAFPFGRRTPPFPALIGLLRLISNDLWFVSIILIIFAATTAPLLFILVRNISSSNTAGFISGIMYAIWPSAISFEGSLYSTVLALPVFLIFLLNLPFMQNGKTLHIKKLLISGSLLAICSFIRPMYLLFLPFVLLIFLFDTKEIKRPIIGFFIFCLSFFSTLAPWSIYSSINVGHFVLISQNGGETLAGGFNANILEMQPTQMKLERRETWTGPGKWIPSYATGYLSQDEQSNLTYSQKDKILIDRTLQWIIKNPLAALSLIVAKLGYMWGYFPWSLMGIRQIMFGALPIIALQAMSIWGLVRLPVIKLGLFRLYSIPLFVSGVAVISWGSWRFRQPADAALIAIFSIVIVLIRASNSKNFYR